MNILFNHLKEKSISVEQGKLILSGIQDILLGFRVILKTDVYSEDECLKINHINILALEISDIIKNH